jgi:hypothetical protein
VPDDEVVPRVGRSSNSSTMRSVATCRALVQRLAPRPKCLSIRVSRNRRCHRPWRVREQWQFIELTEPGAPQLIQRENCGLGVQRVGSDIRGAQPEMTSKGTQQSKYCVHARMQSLVSTEAETASSVAWHINPTIAVCPTRGRQTRAESSSLCQIGRLACDSEELFSSLQAVIRDRFSKRIASQRLLHACFRHDLTLRLNNILLY